MTVIDEKQAEKANAAFALLGGRKGLERFDAAVAELDPDEREIALRAAGRALRQRDAKLTELGKLAEAVEELEKAGALRGIVLEVIRAGERVVAAYVALLGQPLQMVAGLLPDFDAKDLAFGDEVEVVRCGPDSFALRRRVGRHRRYGAVARVEDVDRDVLRVSQAGETFYLRATHELGCEIELAAEPGDFLGRHVSFDPQVGLAFAFFGEPERDALVLRDVPAVKREELIVTPGVARQLEDEVLKPVRHPDLAGAYGLPPARFLLFAGPPGVGKTLAAKWVATELERPVFLINGGELADPWYGGTEAKLRARLDAARREPNGAIVVWDEADAMLLERGSTQVGVENRIVSMLLAFSDGFEAQGDVMLVLTSNRPDLIDGALMRSLRAKLVEFGRPDAPRTRALFELYLRDVPVADGDAASLARDAVAAVFAVPTPLARLLLRDSSRVPVKRGDAVSGALVNAACIGARRRAFSRHAAGAANGRPRGILRDDLLIALDEEFGRLAARLTVENVEASVALPRHATGNVFAVEPVDAPSEHRFAIDTGPRRSAAEAAGVAAS